MCTTCGCGNSGDPVNPTAGLSQGQGQEQSQGRTQAQTQAETHTHSHNHGDQANGGHRLVRIEQDILSHNNRLAAGNRERFAERGLFALNLVSSPGSGKTSLLTKTVDRLKGRLAMGVIEGDQETSHDTERIRATGIPAVQVNTGKGCHLDAHLVGHALDSLALPDNAVLFIENVGNLVCPAAFDLGEAHKVVILSVTEGEDKPIKYPNMFAAADLMLLNKIDLLPHVAFDLDRCLAFAHQVNPNIQVLQLSAQSGVGMGAWCDWIAERLAALLDRRATVLTETLKAVQAARSTLATPTASVSASVSASASESESDPAPEAA